VAKHNSKLTSIFLFHNTHDVINFSDDDSDSFLRNNSSNLPEYSYGVGDHRKKIIIPLHRSILSGN